MWIKADGQLSDSSYLLTTPVSSHLLAFGEVAALVDCGITGLAEELCGAVNRALGNEMTLKYLCITHAHFDHVGGVVSLRKNYPDIQLVASVNTARLLEDKAFVEQMYLRNLSYLKEKEDRFSLDLFYESLKVNKIVTEGDSLELGDGVELRVINCEGHTMDSTGYYLVPDQVLAAAEAVGGFNGRDKVVPCFLNSVDDYLKTLDKLLELNIKVLLLPHSGALTGDLTKRFLIEIRKQVGDFTTAIRAKIREGMPKEEILLDLIAEWTAKGIAPEGPFIDEQSRCIRQMIELCIHDD